MVDRIEFSPLGGIDPRQLFAQRDAREALVNSLATAAPRVTVPPPGSGPAPAPAPEPRPPAERPAKEERRPHEQNAQPNAGAQRGEPNAAPALGGARETAAPGNPAQPPNTPNPTDAALKARLGDAFQIAVPGSAQARAEGLPLFGGLAPAGPENPLTQEFFTPIGGGAKEQTDFGPKPLGGGDVPERAATLASRTTGAPGGTPPPTPQNAGGEQGRNEPRGSVVDVLV